MDACQKQLMLPWMKAVGGRGRDRGRAAALELLFLRRFCGAFFGMRLLPYSGMGRAADESG